MKTMNIKIDHMTKDGVGVTRLEKKPMYVMYGIDHEEIKVNIDFEGKRNVFASIQEIISPSSYRCNPKCSVYYQCGGCHLSHMSYEGQLNFKTNVVKKLYAKDELKHISVHPCVGAEVPYFYRNKVQTPLQRKGKNIIAGFYKEDSHEIVPYEQCFIQDKISDKVIKSVVAAMKENKIEPYNEDLRTGIIRHVLVRRSEKETMLVLITNVNSFAGRNNFVQAIKKKAPEITTIVQNINPRHTNVILGEKENILYGKGYIVDTLCDIQFRISPKSFYQINKKQCEKLYTKAIELAKLSGKEIVLDAYCGIGTIGMIASKKAKEVYGVEIVEDAIKDAKMNAKINSITNCHFYCDDAQYFMKKYDGQRMDVVFIDPPRKGCSEQFLNSLARFKPKKIVYISCNPETQVRDVLFLEKLGYKTNDVYPFDMFPQTFHVETVVLLSHKSMDKIINVKVDFDNDYGKKFIEQVVEKVDSKKSKGKVTYKMIQQYIEEKYEFKVHTAYIAEVKRSLGLPMYDAPNGVEELKHPRSHPTPKMVTAIKDALKYFEII